MRKIFSVLVGVSVAAALLVGCGSSFTSDALFPAEVGGYLRMSGPAVEAETGVDVGTYQGPEGAVVLRIRDVGDDQSASDAVAGLPPLADNVGYDPVLGVREGVFFTYGGEYHAAWENEGWVFVLSSATDAARRAFLAAYGF